MLARRLFPVFMVLLSFAARPVSAATDVYAISGDETWNLSGSPYILNGQVTVPAGVTLTIEAAVSVRAEAASSLRVEGRIVAAGTAAAPVRFRSALSSPQPGDWGGIDVVSSEAGSVLSHVHVSEASTAVHVSAGSESVITLSDITVSTGNIGLHLDDTQVDCVGLVAYGNTTAGVRVDNADSSTHNRIERALLRDNGVGFLIRKSSLLALELEVDHATIAFNEGHAFDMYDNDWPERIRVDVTASALVGNDGFVFYGGNAYGSGVRPVVSWSYCDLWGNTDGVFNLYNDATEGDGNFNYLPLFVDASGLELAPTQRSPLRHNDGADGTVGYFDYEGDPSPGVAGFYWEDKVFEAGEHLLDGDIVVTPRATLTFSPGATIRVATGDVMDGGRDLDRVEILNLGQLVMQGSEASPVRLESAEANPEAGDWYGVIIDGEALSTQVQHVVVAHASRGFHFDDSFHGLSDVEAYDSEVGLFAEGGGPLFERCETHDCEHGVRVIDSDAVIDRLRARRNTVAGVSVELSGAAPSEVLVDRSILDANESYGLRLFKDGLGDLTVVLDRSTVWGNGSDGTYCDDFEAVGRLRFDARYSAIGRNGGQAFGAADRGGDDYAPLVYREFCNVWENAGGAYDWHIVLSEGDGNLSYNPLFRDEDAGDFVPTSNSPLRCIDRFRDDNVAGGDGMPDAAGALDFEGDETGALVGFTHGDLRLTAAGSPYLVEGDLVVTAPCRAVPAEFYVEKGVEVRFVTHADRMRGGLSPSLTELLVRDDFVVEGGRQSALFTSDATEPSLGDWQGVVIEPGAKVEARGFLVTWSVDGFRGYADSDHLYEDGIVRDVSEWGFRLEYGAGPRIVATRVERTGSGGLYLADLTETSFVERCSLIDAGISALRVKNGHARIENNVIVGSDWGVFSRRTDHDDMRVEILNNTFYDLGKDCVRNHNSGRWGKVDFVVLGNQLTWCGGFAILDSGGFDVRDVCDYNNFWRTLNFEVGHSHYGVALGDHSISADPGYQDIDGSGQRRWFDLRLAEDSEGRDAGLQEGWGWDDLIVDEDHLGVPRPLGGGVDIGAYEYDPDAVNHDPTAVATGDTLVPMWEEGFEALACFDASASDDLDGDLLNYHWDFGDGESGEGESPCHAFRGNTLFSVVVRVSDGRGGVDHDIVNVDVNRRPVADAGPEVDAVAGGDAVVFDGSASFDLDGEVVSYLWDFGDGDAGSGGQPAHAFGPGPSRNVTVSLVVTDDDGHESAPSTTVVYITGEGDDQAPEIEHDPITERPFVGSGDVRVGATVTDASGIAEVRVHYRTTGEAAWNEMALQDEGGYSWSGVFPAADVLPPAMEYYLEASDRYITPHTATHPAGAPEGGFHSFEVRDVDVLGPEIEHVTLANGQVRDLPLEVSARVTDRTGVASVTLHFRHVTDPVFDALSMDVDADGETWRATISGARMQPPGLQYYLAASDRSPAENVSNYPEEGASAPLSFTVVEPDGTAPLLAVTPVLDGRPEGVVTAVHAVATDESGIGAVTLYYRGGEAVEFASVEMLSTGVGDGFEGVIQGEAVLPPSVDFYVVAADDSAFANTTTWPDGGAASPASFSVVAEVQEDRTAPVIEHSPPEGPLTPWESVDVAVVITDESGVSEAVLHYRGSDTVWRESSLVVGGGDAFSATVPGTHVGPGELRYYVVATDGAPAMNSATRPPAGAAAPWVVSVANDTPEPDVVEPEEDVTEPEDTAAESESEITTDPDTAEIDVESSPDTTTAAETGGSSDTIEEIDTGAVSSSSSSGGCDAAGGGSSPLALLVALLALIAVVRKSRWATGL